MGACDFYDSGKGDTPKTVFAHLQHEARYMHGHGGYTGTIAEKGLFRYFNPGIDAEVFHAAIMQATWDRWKPEDDPRGRPLDRPRDISPPEGCTLSQYEWGQAIETWEEKWGPAVCCPVKAGTDHDGYAFFGMASC